VTFSFHPQNVATFDALQFRAALNPAYPANEAWWGTDETFANLSVVLSDGSGGSASVAASEVGNDALRDPFGRRRAGHYILNQIRFPLERFTGVDLSNVVSVELVFDQTQTGVIAVSDLAFSRG
jgi:hypothetical protein